MNSFIQFFLNNVVLIFILAHVLMLILWFFYEPGFWLIFYLLTVYCIIAFFYNAPVHTWQIYKNPEAYLVSPFTLFNTVCAILFFYIFIYIMGVPMVPESKPWWVYLTEGILWLFLCVILFLDFFKIILNVSVFSLFKGDLGVAAEETTPTPTRKATSGHTTEKTHTTTKPTTTTTTTTTTKPTTTITTKPTTTTTTTTKQMSKIDKINQMRMNQNISSSNVVVNAAAPAMNAAAPVVNAAAPVVNAAAPVVNAAAPVVNAAAPGAYLSPSSREGFESSPSPSSFFSFFAPSPSSYYVPTPSSDNPSNSQENIPEIALYDSTDTQNVNNDYSQFVQSLEDSIKKAVDGLVNYLSFLEEQQNQSQDMQNQPQYIQYQSQDMQYQSQDMNPWNSTTGSSVGDFPYPKSNDQEGAEVFHVSGNKYTYQQAQEVCEALGAQLATYDQIEEAYNKGANWFDYGWSEGQYAYFPLQKEIWYDIQKQIEINGKDTNNMSKLRPGISGGYFANPNIRFGINCYGVKPQQRPQDIMAKPFIPATHTQQGINETANPYKYNPYANLRIDSFNSNHWSEY